MSGFVGDGAGGLPVGAGGFTVGAGGFPVDAADFPVEPGGRVDGCMLCRDTHTLATVFGKALLELFYMQYVPVERKS